MSATSVSVSVSVSNFCIYVSKCQQLLSQCGSRCSCQSRSVQEIHYGVARASSNEKTTSGELISKPLGTAAVTLMMFIGKAVAALDTGTWGMTVSMRYLDVAVSRVSCRTSWTVSCSSGNSDVY